MNILVNIALYQACWFICVLGENRFVWLAALLLGLHFFLTPLRKSDLILAAKMLAIGLIVDGSLSALGFFSFPAAGLPIPYWLMAIWLALATLPNHSLAWMTDRPLLCLIFGALGGPPAYWAGVRFGAASFNLQLLPSLLILAVVWGLLWPFVMLLSKKTRQAPPAPQK